MAQRKIQKRSNKPFAELYKVPIRSLEFKSRTDLEKIFRFINVPGDGSCGYHALLAAAKELDDEKFDRMFPSSAKCGEYENKMRQALTLRSYPEMDGSCKQRLLARTFWEYATSKRALPSKYWMDVIEGPMKFRFVFGCHVWLSDYNPKGRIVNYRLHKHPDIEPVTASNTIHLWYDGINHFEALTPIWKDPVKLDEACKEFLTENKRMSTDLTIIESDSSADETDSITWPRALDKNDQDIKDVRTSQGNLVTSVQGIRRRSSFSSLRTSRSISSPQSSETLKSELTPATKRTGTSSRTSTRTPFSVLDSNRTDIGIMSPLSRMAPLVRKSSSKGNLSGGTKETDDWRQGKLDANRILAELEAYKCSRDCEKKECKKHLTVETVISARKILYEEGVKRTDRKPHCFRMLMANSTRDKAGQTILRHNFQGNVVCKAAFRTGYSHSRTAYTSCKKAILNGAVQLSPSYFTCKERMKELKAYGIARWMSRYAKDVGMFMPDSDKTMLYETHIRMLYDKYMEENEGESVSYNYFWRCWNDVKKEKNYQLRSTCHTFATCEECARRREQLNKQESIQIKAEIRAQWAQHLKIQRLCRERYYKHRAKSVATQKEKRHLVEYGQSHLSIILDVMDQAKTNLPKTAHKSKASVFEDPRRLMRQALVGCIVHGVGRYAYLVHPPVGTGGGSNLTIDCLVRSLLKVPAPWPKVLYLQMDNCWGDNKNAWVLAFCQYLVGKGFFEKVKVNFLLKGHTHEDIDALFGKLSQRIKGLRIPTLSCFIKTAREVFESVEVVKAKFDYKAWFGGSFDPSIPPARQHKQKHFVSRSLRGISRPHVFKFKKTAKGEVEMHYKKFMVSTEWRPAIRVTPSATQGHEATKGSRHMSPLATMSSSNNSHADVHHRYRPVRNLASVVVGDVVSINLENGQAIGELVTKQWMAPSNVKDDRDKAGSTENDLHSGTGSKPFLRSRVSNAELVQFNNEVQWELKRLVTMDDNPGVWYCSGERFRIRARLITAAALRVVVSPPLARTHTNNEDDVDNDEERTNLVTQEDNDYSDRTESSDNDGYDQEDQPLLPLDDSKAQLEGELNALEETCELCPRLPNKKCACKFRQSGRVRCSKCCDHPDCEVHKNISKHNIVGEKKEHKRDKTVTTKGLRILETYPDDDDTPKVAKWTQWEHYEAMKTNIMSQCLKHDEIDASEEEVEEWKSLFKEYEAVRERMEEQGEGQESYTFDEFIARARRTIAGTKHMHPKESLEYNYDIISGDHITAGEIKEMKQRHRLELLKDREIKIGRGDLLAVYMPGVIDCPEMPLPVRIATAIEESQVGDGENWWKVGYWYPKPIGPNATQTYDGPFIKWYPNTPGRTLTWYKDTIQASSVLANFGKAENAWKKKLSKKTKILGRNALRTLANAEAMSLYSVYSKSCRFNQKMLLMHGGNKDDDTTLNINKSYARQNNTKNSSRSKDKRRRKDWMDKVKDACRNRQADEEAGIQNINRPRFRRRTSTYEDIKQ